ncbi:MAG TPA: ABC transporter ATP-binding protein [Steroidobacteraceae bacterium]|jgi:multiple sugar transport system ATP-binding protein|nr:ABC transporter ATP-binding protein [Steroidobacteraceae bacterium]
MASICVESASRTFPDGTRALDGVNLAVADGECLVLVGPSGCGKSTLLRAVAGLERLDSGRVLIGDADVSGKPAGERDIAMVFQNYALYPQMTVRENLEFGLKSRHMSERERRERVADVAGLLGLGALLSRRPAELSGGQLQRVAMGRAIARRPQAFLMDEPLSNLDAQLRTSMRAELSKMRERLAVTTLYVTHDQVEAMTLGERVAVMREGTIQQCDTPRRLFDRPRNVFVATFMGSPPMNLLKAEITAVGIRFGRYELPLAAGVSSANTLPSTVLVGLRPGDVALDRNAPGHWPRIDVVPHAVEEYGHERIVRFHADASSNGNAEVEVSVLLSGRDVVAIGERLRLGVDTAHLHFFDPESGNALA